jgi:glycosyltransferase involved in cell wall biosynthesis
MTVCLNMIVRNEAHVIRRCLLSHKDIIDHWVIVDTGSTDGTQDLIRKLLADIPGELHERPWVDFGHNRSEALALARGKADYILVNDADHIWHGKLPKNLTADAYAVPYHYAGTVYGVTCVLADRIPGWRYVGVIHEYVDAQQPIKIEPASDAWIEVKHEGARSLDPHTYEKDVAILEAAFDKDPQNPRYAFYLAQSYRDSNESEKALLMYLKRAEMPGWDQETWHAKYQAAIMTERLGRAPETISRAYLEAYNFRPSRAEPLAHLARWHRSRSGMGLGLPVRGTGSEYPPLDRWPVRGGRHLRVAGAGRTDGLGMVRGAQRRGEACGQNAAQAQVPAARKRTVRGKPGMVCSETP